MKRKAKNLLQKEISDLASRWRPVLGNADDIEIMRLSTKTDADSMERELKLLIKRVTVDKATRLSTENTGYPQ